MLSPSLTLLTLCLLGTGSVSALRVPFQTRSFPGTSDYYHRRSRLQPRVNTTVSVKSVANTQYLANITIAGAEFPVILDTGSSDLWVTGNVQTKTDLGKSATVNYAVGKAAGEINAAQVEFAGYTVPDQAFIYVQDASSTGIDTSDISGLIGLGPSASSVIHQTIDTPSADPFLDRVFRQNTSTPNYLTILLGRAGDTGEKFTGQLTIGELVPGFENVTNQAKIPVNVLPGPLKVDQHWSGHIDAIIGPDGQKISLSSLVPGTPANQLVTIFDSGFTIPQVPREVSDAIYGRIQGANYDSNNGFWVLPCDQEVNVTVVIAGQNYPIHPLDTSSKDLATDSSGKPICVGAFQPISTALDGTFDAVMGMGFLRNAYMLINMGDFIDGNPDNQGDPYIQLLSVTNPPDAHQDFVALRLNNVDSTGDNSHTLLPPGQAQHSPSDIREKAKNAFFRYWPWLVGGIGLLIAVGLAWVLFRCCCRRRASRPFQGGFGAGSYRPLHEPSPAPAMDLHMMPPPHGAYADPYQGGHHY